MSAFHGTGGDTAHEEFARDEVDDQRHKAGQHDRGAAGAARFQFELLPTFPVGTLKLRATADASDLAEYLVDGTPQVLDLLPFTPLDQTVTVQ